MNYDVKRILAVFYCTENGTNPVREWLMTLDNHDRFLIGTDIKTVEYGWPVGMSVCRPLGSGLFEVRTTLKDRIARVIFCFSGGKMILLHGFIKKNQKTPKSDLETALKRKQNIGDKK